MSKKIVFTQMHEDLLVSNSEAIKGISEAIKDNGEAIRSNSEAIKGNSEAIKGNSEAIKDNGEAIRSNSNGIRRLEVLMEDQKSAINSILEVVMHTDARIREQDQIAKRVDSHEHRISALENHVKRQ